ncbi:MAG: restriction endonuclease subunit S [Erysipelotrichaceae bacterium]|nr:restriction endonuclease subunit S [Erysipelotrichaceae bacterium]
MGNLAWNLFNLTRGQNISVDEVLQDFYISMKLKETNNNSFDQDSLMKVLNSTKIEGPTFNGDKRMLASIYQIVYGMNNKEILDCITELQESFGARNGARINDALAKKLVSNIKPNMNKILVCDAEKYGTVLYETIQNSKAKFYLTIYNESTKHLYKEIYKELNVEFIESDIYKYEFVNLKFDLILCFPVMGVRKLAEVVPDEFISRDMSFVATQNLLYHLSASGKLIIILPAKIGFASGDAKTLREYLQNNYKINEISSLPTKLFHPYMAINTYLLSISNGETDDIYFNKYELDNGEISSKDTKLVFFDELEGYASWNVDMIFSYSDESILEYKNSNTKKSKLSDVAEVFRGKAILNKSSNGAIGVLNISNITDTGIDYSNLDSIDEEERKVSRYLLQDGDVLITTKGFNVKVAVFEKQSRPCIASSNLCVVRTNQRLLDGTYLKLFLESSIGIKLLESMQRGTSIVNINYQDICQLEVPTPSIDDQKEIANEYNKGLKVYKQIIDEATDAWNKVKNNVQSRLY